MYNSTFITPKFDTTILNTLLYLDFPGLFCAVGEISYKIRVGFIGSPHNLHYFIYLFIYLSIYLFTYLFIYLFIYLFVSEVQGLLLSI
jgi:hypothetical protein